MYFNGKYVKVDEKFGVFLVGCYGEEGLREQLYQMEAWLEVNPRRRKKNYRRFVVNWLNRAAKEWAEKRVRQWDTERELRAGMGPRPFECKKCHRRLVAAFLPATCPRCGSLHSFLESV